MRTGLYAIDALAPAGTVLINGGAAYTRSATVTLTLSCVDDRGCSQLQLSNDGATWSTFPWSATTRTWSLSAGNGEKTVYGRFRDAAGNWSETASDAASSTRLRRPAARSSPRRARARSR